MKKFIITGGLGFISRNVVVKILESSDAEILLIDNDSQKWDQVLSFLSARVSPARLKDVMFVEADVKRSLIAQIPEADFSHMIHLAANTGVLDSFVNPVNDAMSNIIGTLNVLEFAKHTGCSMVISASSGAVADGMVLPLHELSAINPKSPYGISKYAAEMYSSVIGPKLGLKVYPLRFSNVYGQGCENKGSVIAKMAKDAKSNGIINIFGDGEQTRDFICVSDVCSAILSIAKSSLTSGEVFQICTGNEITILEIAKKIKTNVETLYSREVNFSFQDANPNEVIRNFGDPSKAKELLGWNANVDLNSGIADVVNYIFEV